MTITDAADQYFTYENRLASFQTSQQLSKRRASNASTKTPKSLKWPHRFLTPEELAKAGFFYYPLQANPDNVACFLCHKALDGWEEDDDPLAEHLKHSPDCGWAIVASVERQDGDLSDEYPLSARMIEARKGTFAGRWPHEDKKGWKCKVKQMVDAGWKYTPSEESDDMATCAYCALALDGWEKSDKPLDEHHSRSSDCPFFILVSNYKQSPKRTKSKRDRTSKASRLSTQSTFTINSEAPSILDLPAEEGDSILTTAKNMTKAKQATAVKGRKTRTKNDEPTQAPEPEDADFEVKIEVPGPGRGKKRKSEELAEVMKSTARSEAPPPKRRATRTRGSTAVDSSIIEGKIEDSQPKVRGRNVRTSRKASTASQAPLNEAVPNDDEIERALEADLERPLTDNEIRQTTVLKTANSHRSMFEVDPVNINEADIEAELDAMDTESKVLPKARSIKPTQPRKVSAKQRAATKKAAKAEAEAQRAAEEEASQQIAAELEHSISIQNSSPILPPKRQRITSRQSPRSLPPLPDHGSVMPIEDDAMDIDEGAKNDSGNETDASIASQSTVVRGGSSRRGSALKKGKGGRKGPSRNIEEIVHKSQESISITQTAERGTVVKAKQILHVENIHINEERFYTPAPEAALDLAQGILPKETRELSTKPRGRPPKNSDISSEGLAPEVEPAEALQESAPVSAAVVIPPHRSPTPPPKELTPSQSPNSSDAENQPPSSKPSAASKQVLSTPRSAAKRIPLTDATPLLSPSKRNVIAGLRTNQPWTSVDLDVVFMKSPNEENADNPFGAAEERVKKGDLTSPEKKMTVEEWIHFNAEMAEEKLRNECDRMVGTFESQGTRAMRALEGIKCLD